MTLKIIGELWRMSLQSSALILVILAARLPLKRYSKLYSYSLWMLAAVSLLCPVRLSSPLCLLPSLTDITIFSDGSQEKAEAQKDPENSHIENDGNPATALNLHSQNTENPGSLSALDTGASGLANIGASPRTPAFAPHAADRNSVYGIFLQIIIILYLTGVGAIFLYFLAQYLRIHRRIACAVHEDNDVWLCEAISSPFVIGVRKPRIIFPYAIAEPEKSHILQHERTHIRHRDPLARLVWCACLCLHWWNPLVWLAAHFMEQDMEMFCDESALHLADRNARKAYAKTLLSCAGKQSGLTIGPAFGKSNTERRVENLMKKKKNNLIVLFCVLLLALFCIGAFMTRPEAQETPSQPKEAPVYFGEFALADQVVYRGFIPEEEPQTLPLPVETNYCAIYHDELYYAAEQVGTETGTVEDGHLTFYTCALDGTNPRKLMELPEIFAVGDTVLSDGVLYCSYIKTEDADSTTIASAPILQEGSGNDKSEYLLPNGHGRILHFGKDCISYYQLQFTSNHSVPCFYTYYPETGELIELYRFEDYFMEDCAIWDDQLLLLLHDNEKMVLLSVDKEQNITNYGSYELQWGKLFVGKSAYCSMGNALYRLDDTKEEWILVEHLLPENVEASHISPFEEKEDNLYYTVSVTIPGDEWTNTFLMQYNMESGEKVILRKYYQP